MRTIGVPTAKIATFVLLTLLVCCCSVAMALSSPSPPVAMRTSSSLGPQLLQKLVQKASIQEQDSNVVDLKGVAWLEHINLVVGSNALAEIFYQGFLGLSRDPDATFHVNLGQQQFHLAETSEKNGNIEKIVGSVGLVVPDLQTVRDRLEDINKKMAILQQEESDNKEDKDIFQIVPTNDDNGSCMTVSCPWGNTYHLYCAKHDKESLVPTSTSAAKMVKLHSQGGTYATDRMTVRGKPGIRYIELTCPQGTIPAIAKFYQEIFDCTTTTLDDNALAVSVGPGVHLVFAESTTLNNELLEQEYGDMKGVHVCIYTPNFQELYTKLTSKQLIWTNPRFTHLDSCDTWEEALRSRTLRFKDIIDLDTGAKIMELEHETRPMRHGQYMKVPYYVPK